MTAREEKSRRKQREREMACFWSQVPDISRLSHRGHNWVLTFAGKGWGGRRVVFPSPHVDLGQRRSAPRQKPHHYSVHAGVAALAALPTHLQRRQGACSTPTFTGQTLLIVSLFNRSKAGQSLLIKEWANPADGAPHCPSVCIFHIHSHPTGQI